MTLFYCSRDQVGVSSICFNFCWSYAPFETLIFDIQFPHFFRAPPLGGYPTVIRVSVPYDKTFLMKPYILNM